MSNDETPAAKRLGLWSYLIGIIVFRTLNAIYWAITGGLGWGFGSVVGSFLPWPDAIALGGAAGLALALLAVLTDSQPFQYLPITLGLFGGLAVGCSSLLILNPFGQQVNLALGAAAGFVVAAVTAIINRNFCLLNIVPACLI